MFKTLANSVRAELCKEGQDPGVDQCGEQGSQAEGEGPGIGVPAGVNHDESGKKDQKRYMGDVKRIGEASKLPGRTNGARAGSVRGIGGEQYPKEERGDHGEEVIAIVSGDPG
jgi:hypothetical protein